ncbi:MAG: adaptor protein MecA [Clostridia bacterium]|nr:adaptor protein MecA [Clostridia bacterium]
MELILISESKLKIMLTADDMADYSITNECMSYENNDTRRMFGKILEKAKEKTGFDSSLGKLFIQVYPAGNGGCEVYVTTENVESCRGKKQDKSQNTPKKKKEYCVYMFNNLTDAVEACKTLKKCRYENESVFFAEEQSGVKKYYLVLQEEMPINIQPSRRRGLCKSDLAEEFGKRVDCKNALMYINEHAKKLVENNAVEVLCRF